MDGVGARAHYPLIVMSLADRVVAIAGITTRPDEAWILQVGRNLTVGESGALRSNQYLIIDRDSKCTDQFRRRENKESLLLSSRPGNSPDVEGAAPSRDWELRIARHRAQRCHAYP